MLGQVFQKGGLPWPFALEVHKGLKSHHGAACATRRKLTEADDISLGSECLRIVAQAPCPQVPGALQSFQSESEDAGFLKHPVRKLFGPFARCGRMLKKLEMQLLIQERHEADKAVLLRSRDNSWHSQEMGRCCTVSCGARASPRLENGLKIVLAPPRAPDQNSRNYFAHQRF